MILVNIRDIKTQFSKLVKQALNGEEIIIVKEGKRVVKLIPYSEQVVERRGGQFKGLIEIIEDFDAPLPDEYLKLFNGELEKK